MYSFFGVCWRWGSYFVFHNLFFKRTGGWCHSVWSVGSSTSQLQTVTLHFITAETKRSCSFKNFVCRCVWVITLRLVLDRGWLRLLNLHGSDGVSTGSLWRSGVIPSVPGSWKMPMEMGRSFLELETNWGEGDVKGKRLTLKEKENRSVWETDPLVKLQVTVASWEHGEHNYPCVRTGSEGGRWECLQRWSDFVG